MLALPLFGLLLALPQGAPSVQHRVSPFLGEREAAILLKPISAAISAAAEQQAPGWVELPSAAEVPGQRQWRPLARADEPDKFLFGADVVIYVNAYKSSQTAAAEMEYQCLTGSRSRFSELLQLYDDAHARTSGYSLPGWTLLRCRSGRFILQVGAPSDELALGFAILAHDSLTSVRDSPPP